MGPTASSRWPLAVAGALTLAAVGAVLLALFHLAALLAPSPAAADGPATSAAAIAARRAPLLPLPRQFLAVLAPAEEPSAVPPDHPFARTRVTGRVYDIATNEGVAATIRVHPTYGEPRLGTSADGAMTFVSGGDGGFAMRGIPPGTFDVVVVAPGFLPLTTSFKKLGALEDDDGFDLGLDRSCPVEGRVVTMGGKPVRGAHVTAGAGRDLRVTSETPTTVSGDDGRFILDAVGARDVTLYVTHPDFEPVTLLLPASDEPSREVEVLVSAGRRLVGTVRDAHGPVRGAEVYLEMVSSSEHVVVLGASAPRFGTRTDGDGRFALTAGQGLMAIGVDAPGYRRALQRVSPGWDDDSPIEMELFLEPAASIDGRVLTADGKPASMARVVVTAESTFATAETNQAGVFHVVGLPLDGPYELTIHHHAHAPFNASLPDLAGAHVYVLGAQSRIVGRVVDARTGLPVTRYELRAVGPIAAHSGAESLSGALEIDQLEAGTYQLTVEAEDYRPATVDGIEVPPGGTSANIVVRMEPSATIAGRVRGNLDGEILVQAFSEDGDIASNTVAEQDGTFVLRDLSPGIYALRASGPEVAGTREGLQVPPGASLADVVIPVSPVGASPDN